MQLTPEQLEVKERLESSRSAIRLTAPPGSGKSTIVNHLATRPVLLAPTNKAAAIIGGQTIHSYLHLGLKAVGDKQVTVATRQTPKMPYLGQVVIDEFSCIPPDILNNYVLPLLPNVIFTGDDYQLPPVNWATIPVMDLDIPELRLEYCHRFGGEILDVANEVRKSIGSDKDFSIPDKWKGSMGDLGADDVVIAWRNDTVNYYNRKVKMAKFGTTDWVVGESVRIGSFYKALKLPTESEWVVTKVEKSKHIGYKCWLITLNNQMIVPVVHEDAMEDYKETVDFASQTKNWHNFWRLKDGFCDLRPSFAITCHKSQGSTYRNVYVDFEDIFNNPKFEEAKRCAYVAMTRARESVTWLT